jgi:gliding motility-associated transport system permease protein/gliding motility-associatede transport system auxiliary component
MFIRRQAVGAVFRRNLHAFFGNPTGYVFITVFIIAMAFLAFGASFFANNMADLSALNAVFIWLPALFVPAITMSAWADERRMGTDELLFTLPVSDTEIALGKYLAALAVYSAALLFAVSNAVVLAILGDPDWGLLFAGYVGYWIVGAALIPLGMVASALTENVTVAFILGVVLCLAFVLVGDLASLTLGVDSRIAAGLGAQKHFMDFTLGVISIPDVLYFLLVAGVAFYANIVLLARRHWPSGGGHRNVAAAHQALRVLSLIVAAVALSVLVGRWGAGLRIDTTAERINSISDQTEELITALPGDTPVYVQAYISDEVPDQLVPVRENLLRLLREIDAVGGDRVVVNVTPTEMYSDEADQADERFGIKPRRVAELRDGRASGLEVFLGLAMTCGAQEDVIPFFDLGLSAEYEIVRALQVVAQQSRPKVGILVTDAKLFGSFNFQARSQTPDWQIVHELRKQYDVTQVTPAQGIDPDLDVLIAPLPSSLTDPDMAMLTDYIRSGKPTLLLLDPLPVQFPQLSPSQPKPNANPYGGQAAPPKGDIGRLLQSIGISWTTTIVAWDAYNPLPKYPDIRPEFVFACPEGGNVESISTASDITRDLSRVVLLFPGIIAPTMSTTTNFTPLITTGAESGALVWSQIVTTGFMGMQFTPEQFIRYNSSGQTHVVAARVKGPVLVGGPEMPPTTINAIVVADLDFIADSFFQMRSYGDRDMQFDNIPFILNCVDTLAGNDDLIALRSREPRFRTLTTIEARRSTFEAKLKEADEAADKKATGNLADAQMHLDAVGKSIDERTDLDPRSKNIMREQRMKVEQRRFDQAKSEINEEKARVIATAKKDMHRQVRRIESSVRLLAVILPPLPALLVGLLVFLGQAAREKAGRPLSRSMRSN